MLLDYHIHTKRCGHAAGEMSEYVAAVKERGIREIGFADHIYMYWLPAEQRDRGLAMAAEELPDYVQAVLAMRRANPDLPIKLGLEADFIPGAEAALAEILSLYSFDYILGSVHFLGEWAFDDPDRMDEYQNHSIDDLYVRYFRLVQQAARSGLFDIMAHPDLIKKFNFRPSFDLTSLYQETAAVFKEAGVCVEVNAAGWRYPVGEQYPAAAFLKICLDHGVPVTLGSDAHKPELAGEGLDRGAALLRRIGYRQVMRFDRRMAKPVAL